MPVLSLHELFDAIDTRVAAIRKEFPDWRCAKGCDACCRQLAAPPRLTPAEWQRLRQGVERLPAHQQTEIRRRVAAQVHAAATDKSLAVCPLLDLDSGSCPVYGDRPVACRSYGYYRQRDKGLFCEDIRRAADQGTLDEVIWGNHEVVDRQLTALGDSRALADWFATPS